MATRKTMTLNLTETEMTVLEQLCSAKDLSKTALLRQALRLYQMLECKTREGQKLYFENDSTKEKAELMLI